MPAPVVAARGVVCTSVSVTRADGTTEPPYVAVYRDPRPVRQALVESLLRAGDRIDPAMLARTSTLALFRRLVRRSFRG